MGQQETSGHEHTILMGRETSEQYNITLIGQLDTSILQTIEASA